MCLWKLNNEWQHMPNIVFDDVVIAKTLPNDPTRIYVELNTKQTWIVLNKQKQLHAGFYHFNLHYWANKLQSV